jgi:hypothetical protein
MLSSTVLAEVMQCSEGRKYMNNQSSLLGQPAMLMRVKSLIFGVYFRLRLQTMLGNDDGDDDSVNTRFQSLSIWMITKKKLLHSTTMQTSDFLMKTGT